MLIELARRRVRAWWFLPLLAAGCGHSRTANAGDDQWVLHARAYIEADSRLDKENLRRRRAAERALIRDPLPGRSTLERLIVGADPATRHAAIVAVMVHGTADEVLARAILRKWRELGRAEKMDAVTAVSDNDLQRSVSLQDEAGPVFSGERDPKVQLVILGAVRSEWPFAKLTPLLTEYAEHGADTVRITAYAIAVELGRGAAENLEHELRKRGATGALSVIERWKREPKGPCSDEGDVR